MSEPVSRRDFLRASAGAGLAAALSSSRALGVAQPEKGKPLRVAHIGVGGRGTHLLRAVLGIPGVEVVAICDINPANRDRAVALVEKRSGKRPEAACRGPYDYRKILARDDIHCVVIAVPCYWHSTMYIDAINAGMHFYGEKPLAITAWGVKAVNEAYKKNPKVVMQIGFQWGSHPARRDIINQVRDGLIGELLDANFQRLNGWGGPGGPGSWYRDRNLSGDWMLEQAVHEFNLMWMVTKTHPVSCFTAGRRGIVPGYNTVGYYTTVLQYPESLKNLVVHYTHTWIEVPKFDRGGFRAQFVGRKGALDVMGAYVRLRRGAKRIDGKGGAGDTREHLENFFDCVRAGTPEKTHCGIENGTAASYIGLMIRQSLEAGRPVTLEETLKDTRMPPVPKA